MNNRETFWLGFIMLTLYALVGLAGFVRNAQATHTPIAVRITPDTFDSGDIEYAEGQQKVQLKKGAASNSVAFFRFEGDWDDEFSLNNGTAYGDAAFGSPIVGINSATFDGTGDYVEIGNSPALYTADFTLVARIKRAGGLGSIQYIVQAADVQTSVQTFNWGLYLNAANKMNLSYGRPSWVWGDVVSTTALSSTSVSNCIAVTVSGTSYAFYLEGAADGTGSLAGAINVKSANASPVDIGAGIIETGSYQNGYWFNGQLDDVAIFNSPLSQATISAICANTLTPRRGYPTTGPRVNTVCLDLAGYSNNDIVNACVPSSTATAETDIRVRFSLDNRATYYPTGAWANLVIDDTAGTHCVNGTQFADQAERLITNSPTVCFDYQLNSDGTVRQEMGTPYLTDVEATGGGGGTVGGSRSGLAPAIGVKGAFR